MHRKPNCRWLLGAVVLLATSAPAVRAENEDAAAALVGHVTRAQFGRQVDLHVLAVQRLSRLWWRMHAPRLIEGATQQQQELLLDLLAELSRVHDVSKRGTLYRNDPRFRDEFDALEEQFNDYYGRRDRARLPVTRGADLLHDLLGVRIFAKETGPVIAALGKRSVSLINAIDAVATGEVMNSRGFDSLPAKWKYAILGGISLCDLTHRHLASLDRKFERGGVPVTQVEFGAALIPAALYLRDLASRGLGIPGVPTSQQDAYPITWAIADAGSLEVDANVKTVVWLTSMPADPNAYDPCAWHLAYPRDRR